MSKENLGKHVLFTKEYQAIVDDGPITHKIGTIFKIIDVSDVCYYFSGSNYINIENTIGSLLFFNTNLEAYEAYEDLKDKELEKIKPKWKYGSPFTFNTPLGEIKAKIHKDFIGGGTVSSGEIFRRLGLLTDTAKIEFCTQAYGYAAKRNAGCPTSKFGDHAALGRLVELIQKTLKEQALAKEKTTLMATDPSTYVFRGANISFYIGGEFIKYKVESSYLHINSECNNLIFNRLGWDKERVKAEASASYGYSGGDGFFPETHYEDYAALQRFIERIKACCNLHDEIEKKEEEVEKETYAYKIGDNVFFEINGKTIVYRICSCYLKTTALPSGNGIIFKELGWSTSKLNAFCASAYGYEPAIVGDYSSFPEYYSDDIDALNAVITQLQRAVTSHELNRLADIALSEKEPTFMDIKSMDIPEPELLRDGEGWVSHIITGKRVAKPRPTFSGVSEFTKEVEDVSLDSLKVDDLTINK